MKVISLPKQRGGPLSQNSCQKSIMKQVNLVPPRLRQVKVMTKIMKGHSKMHSNQ